MKEGDLLKDQRGSPAYISPDVLSGRPYLGKGEKYTPIMIVLYVEQKYENMFNRIGKIMNSGLWYVKLLDYLGWFLPD